jgi:hypothetical protein
MEEGDMFYNTVWVCQACFNLLCVDVSTSARYGLEPLPKAFNDQYIKILRTYPDPSKTDAPEYTPEPIAKAYRQGMENFNRKAFEPCTMLMRKAVDLTAKHINPEATGVLAKRLAQAFEKGLITRDMAEWAKAIKDFGNDSVHDAEDVPEDVARDMTYFTEMLLLYIFTLPGMLAARRNKARKIHEGQ